MLNAAAATMPLPLAQWPRLERVTDAAARAINMIYGRNQPVGFTCNDGAFRLRWRHCSAAFVPQAMARLDVAGKPGWLALESMAIIPGLNAGDVALLPYPLRGALIMQAFAAALDRLQSLTQKGIHVEVLNEPIQLDDVAQRVYFVLENVQTNLSSWGFVQLEDAASWQTLANACALLTSHPALQWREFATTLRFDIGTTHLTLAESAMLERGDWLLIETARRDANGLECTMRAPGLRYTLRGRIESTQVTILEVNKTMQREDEMPIEASQTDLEALARARADLFTGPEGIAARGCGHRARRRNARSRNHPARAHRGGNRPARLRHAAHEQRAQNRGPTRGCLPRRPAVAGPHHAREFPPRRRRATPAETLRHRRPSRGE